MSKAILIQADDWEGLFIDGNLVKEGHTVNDGISRVKYLLHMAKHYNFDLEELKEVWIDEEDDDILYDVGHFPTKLSDMQCDYEKEEEI